MFNEEDEEREMRLFKKKYGHVLLLSSPFAVMCFLGYFKSTYGEQPLLLVCGIVHTLSTVQSNMVFYTQNIPTIKITHKTYISIFLFCEFFYRLVFLSYFY